MNELMTGYLREVIEKKRSNSVSQCHTTLTLQVLLQLRYFDLKSARERKKVK